GGVIVSAFRTWQQEHRASLTCAAELERCHKEATEVVIPDVSDPLYWLVSMAQRHGLGREFVAAASGGQQNSIWVGETPISFQDSKWFYELVSDAEKRGILHQESRPGGSIYRIPHETEVLLNTERRRRRPIHVPAQPIHDTRSGQQV